MGDAELLALMKRIAAAERTLSVFALAHLGEIHRRKLYEDAGFTSMFFYCVGELRYSESNAYRRLQAAEAARKFPEVLSMLNDGLLTVCALSVIAKHLTPENSAQLLKRVEGKSVRAIERLVAELAPLPDTRDSIRLIPAAMPSSRAVDARIIEASISPSQPVSIPPSQPVPIPPSPSAAVAPVLQWLPAPLPPDRIVPRSLDRVQFSFTGSEELRRITDRLKELLWHKFPAGRLEDVLLEAGKAYLKLKDPELRPVSEPRTPRQIETRTAPRWVKSAVYRRDGGRCAYLSAEGRRCEARRGLEYDHIRPWARGGRSDDPSNIRLLCRAHNQSAARAAGLG